MFSTFMGIEIGKRSMQTAQSSLYITQNNIANANNPDYSRQVVTISTFEPLYLPQISMPTVAGQVGQGSFLQAIERVKDFFLENKIMNENSFLSNFSTIVSYIQRLDSIYNEPYGKSLYEAINQFFNAFNELSKDPESVSKRALLVEKAQYMIDLFHDKFDKIKSIQEDLNKDLDLTIDKANQLIKQIALLNDKIKKIEATGQRANDLKDQRDKLIIELSNIIPISTKDSEDFYVYLDGKIIIQGKEYNELEKIYDNNNKGFVYAGLFGERLFINNAKIAALITMRDNIVEEQLTKINQLALSILEGVNNIHQQGKTLSGKNGVSFFKELPLSLYVNGEYDSNSDGFSDRNVIYKLIGTKKLNLTDKLMISGTLNINGKQINYYENDTVEDLIKRVNLANIGVNIQLNSFGYLEIKGNASSNGIFSIEHLEDSGLFLSSFSGILKQNAIFDKNNLNAYENFFDGQIYLISPEKNIASWIELSKDIKSDLNNIAAASIDKDLKEGDGSIALKISLLNKENFFVQNSYSIADFYQNMINDYASFGFIAKQNMDNHKLLLSNFENLKLSYSGVNMDEEFSNMMKFQKMYQATAKFITTLNDIYETLIGIVR
ncbi:MAG: flagellar hook-associated protein FlgK [Spirochaetes bacterium]|nr:flagellar hook-associated protein FlgK [Spirochaetota bacterium]